MGIEKTSTEQSAATLKRESFSEEEEKMKTTIICVLAITLVIGAMTVDGHDHWCYGNCLVTDEMQYVSIPGCEKVECKKPTDTCRRTEYHRIHYIKLDGCSSEKPNCKQNGWVVDCTCSGMLCNRKTIQLGQSARSSNEKPGCKRNARVVDCPCSEMLYNERPI